MGTHLARDDGLAERACERVDDGQEHGHAEEEPEPLDGRNHRHGAHVTRGDHQHVRPDDGRDSHKVLTGHQAEVEDEQGGCDRPIDIAGIKELPAARDGSPALAREHREVGEGRHAADESVAEVVFPALGVRTGSLGHHDDG